MQQVLLAGGPYPADGLVSSLEMCARRGGSTLPAVGQLTLDHLAPLQTFVRENSSVSKVISTFISNNFALIKYPPPVERSLDLLCCCQCAGQCIQSRCRTNGTAYQRTAYVP